MSILYGHQSEEIRELQTALIAHGFSVGPDGADGKFWNDTRQGVMDAQHAFKLSPADGVVRGDLLSFLGLVEPTKAKSNPLQNWLIDLAIKQAVSRLKGLPQMQFLLGTKTAITGVVMIVVGAASLLAPIVGLGAIPGLDVLSPGEAMAVIGNGFGLIFLRGAVAKIGG